MTKTRARGFDPAESARYSGSVEALSSAHAIDSDPAQRNAMSPARVLVVAFHFPPVAAAGTHRTLNFVRQLAARGHVIGVVTTGTFHGLGTDEHLFERVPAGVHVSRAPHFDPFIALRRLRGRAHDSIGSKVANGSTPRAAPFGSVDRSTFAHLRDYVSRCFDVPDRYASWILPAVLRGTALARKIDAQLIYSTAPPFSAHVVGLLLKAALGLRWVADFRDPWATNPFKVQPYPSLRVVDEALEAAVVKRADRVILNTELCERGYRDRYPDHPNFVTIPNGIDPDLLDAGVSAAPRDGAPKNELRLLHVGTIYGRRSPLGLLLALKHLADTRPSLAQRITIEQLGSVENEVELRARARELGVADRFSFLPPVPHARALAMGRDATGLLLLGVSGDRPEVQVPAKLFEYLAIGRPILALAKRGGAIAATLASAQASHVIADPDDPLAIAHALEQVAEEWPRRREPTHHAGIAQYRYDALATRLEREFEALVPARAPSAGDHDG